METNIPSGMTRENTCCFTGHRHIPPERYEEFMLQLPRIISILADNGYRYFLCGGALGFDTLAAQTVSAVSRSRKEVHLILALPCLDQTYKWLGIKNGEEHIREYQRLKGLAESIIYVSELYTDTCMKERNRFMVEHSSFCVAYFKGNIRSGTGQTYRMAEKAGLTIYNLHDGSSVEPE